MRFTAAYAASPSLLPDTRASILTGQYPARWGINDFIPGHWRPFEKLVAPANRRQYLPLEAVTFAEAIKSAGYISGAFGKWHLGNRNFYPDRQGFDSMLVHHGSHFRLRNDAAPKISRKVPISAEVLTDEAVEFITVNKETTVLSLPDALCGTHPVTGPNRTDRQIPQQVETRHRSQSPRVRRDGRTRRCEYVGRILDTLENLESGSPHGCDLFLGQRGAAPATSRTIGPIVSSNAPIASGEGHTVRRGNTSTADRSLAGRSQRWQQ